jgi:hypothetical protein
MNLKEEFMEWYNRQNENFKATATIILFFVLLACAIIIPIFAFQDLNYSDDDFPEYQNIKINQNKLDDEYEYENIKTKLENDYYFNKLAIMMEYDSEHYTSSNLDKMVWHMIFNLEKENTDIYAKIDKQKEIYCLNKKKFLDAFEELYDVNIKEDEYLLKGYYQYVYDKGMNYCLDFKNVALDYDNDVKIAVERVAMIGTVITTDIYVYEYYAANQSLSNSNINDLKNAIASKNYTGAKNIVQNKLYGTVTHKQIRFKTNKYGKYFKYKIISVNNLDY